MIVIWWISRAETSEIAYSQTRKYHEEITQQLKLAFEQRIETIESASLDLFANEDFQTLIKPAARIGGFHNLHEDYYQIEKILLHFTNKTGLRSMTIYQNRTDLFTFGSYNFKFKSVMEASSQPWYTTANIADGAVVWRTTELDSRTDGDETVLTMVRSLKDISTNTQIGYMQIDIPASYFYTLINQTSTGATGHVILLNRNDEIIAYSEQNEILQYFARFESFPDIGWEKGANQTQHGEWRGDDHPTFILFRHEINEQLRLVSAIERAEVFSSVRAMDRRNIIVLILSIILPVFLLLVIHFVFLRPLLRLAKQLRQSNTIDQLQIPYTDRDDEIGIIAGSIRNLVSQLRRLIDEVYVQKIKQQEAELRTIQTQINPHLLYNTLDSINLLAFKNDMPDIQQMIGALSKFFRISLSKGRDLITIREEIDHVRAFIMLQKYRLDFSLDVRYEIDDRLLDCPTVKCVLQPLVENALFHGFNSDLSQGVIVIKAYTEDTGNIVLSVCDNGVGFPKDKWEDIIHNENKAHHGLWNIHKRVQLVYGQSCGLRLRRQETGSCISICYDAEKAVS
jgi:two-component system sensor histidine kinase YesM